MILMFRYIIEKVTNITLKKDCEDSNIAGMFQTILDACRETVYSEVLFDLDLCKFSLN